ncbi:putative nucleic-acid-binding Zn-ribbon protein [Labrenzia sp. EL_208]|nr:putative nucleic-acid-binding Zn-ribbon protein [Labrenzia sp. EL_132]MBG6231566.1 putative nucleic-acid-binding Zn-ribbon protein [Labrenzia sp. EL_208]
MKKTIRGSQPVTIGFVKSVNGSIMVDCLNCSYHEIISFEGLHDHELVIDLPVRRNWCCPRCGSIKVDSRPKYNFGFEEQKLMGLDSKH